MDTLNSDNISVEVDVDEDGIRAWDKERTARCGCHVDLIRLPHSPLSRKWSG